MNRLLPDAAQTGDPSRTSAPAFDAVPRRSTNSEPAGSRRRRPPASRVVAADRAPTRRAGDDAAALGSSVPVGGGGVLVTALPARMNTLTAQVKAVMPAVMTVFLVALFLGTAFGSLVMSANGTMTFAVNHHVPPDIQWAPVLVLELSQVAGTVWWLVSAGWSRAGAVVMVAGIAAVTACHVPVLYGWALALSATVAMVATIHAIACVVRADSQSRRRDSGA